MDVGNLLQDHCKEIIIILIVTMISSLLTTIVGIIIDDKSFEMISLIISFISMILLFFIPLFLYLSRRF
jgi:hypothetical protein